VTKTERTDETLPSHTRCWLVADRPLGRELAAADFRLEERPLPQLTEGQVLLRTRYLSFDPAQKGMMENLASYAEPTDIGSVMPGQGVGEVLASRSPQFTRGALASGPLGWREYAALDAACLEPVPEGVSPTDVLGILGITGLTAYVGLLLVGRPRPGDVLVISGAAGAVGSVAGQIGKLGGCRVIGIAGGREKCDLLVRELGFDAAIDYKSEKLRSRLRELCPGGIDVFFDNVGGTVLNDCLARLAFGARVVICGGIARYNADPRKPEQVPPGPQNYFGLVHTNASMQGFLVHHYREHYPLARQRLSAWVKSGVLRHKEDVVEGFENAPRALMRLFSGANIGKQLLKV
jgi:NADPH-dependent curcumin reductase CurA